MKRRSLNVVMTALLASVSLTVLSCEEEEEPAPYAGVWNLAYRVPAKSGVGTLADLWFNSATDGWACADDYVLRYQSGRWSVFKDLSREGLYESGYVTTVCALTADDLWVGGQFQTQGDGAATLLHFDGDAWQAIDVGGAWVSDIYFFAPDRGWIAGQDGIFYHDGSTWTKQLGNDASSLAFLSDDFGWAIIRSHLSDVFLWDGSTWNPEKLDWPPQGDLIQTDFVSRTEGWLIGRGYESGADRTYGIVNHKTGGEWNAAPWPDDQYPTACDFLSPTYGWIGSYGACYYWDGNRFQAYALPEIGYSLMGVASIYAIAEDDVWVGSRPHFTGGTGYAYILHFSGFDG
jgi:hypothetical protein